MGFPPFRKTNQPLGSTISHPGTLSCNAKVVPVVIPFSAIITSRVSSIASPTHPSHPPVCTTPRKSHRVQSGHAQQAESLVYSGRNPVSFRTKKNRFCEKSTRRHCCM